MNKELKSIFDGGITVGDEVVPVSHIRYTENSSKYVLWTITDETPTAAADDEFNYSIVTVDIDIYTPENLNDIKRVIMSLMRSNEWKWLETSPEMYEEDTKLFHRTITFEKEEFING